MCAWTRKIRFNGEWVSFETFRWERFGLCVGHGLSEEALLTLTVRRTQ
ncbi:MAG TPA: hypothetical protein VNN09_00195 [Candidatus Competibacteraceae bacterium]|nr:hypothetical protein [Candidatus Competibacteraceae bacterium]